MTLSPNLAEIFNVYYASNAMYPNDDDGLNNLDILSALEKHSNHPSITLIKETVTIDTRFNFKFLTPDIFHKYLVNIPTNKATGSDGIEAKFLRMSAGCVSNHFCDLFNLCILKSQFPDSLKLADISPVFKKDDNLNKKNYRPINVLSVLSKVYERIMADQLILYFMNILHSSLSAYRKGYSSQHVSLNLNEYWRDALCR